MLFKFWKNYFKFLSFYAVDPDDASLDSNADDDKSSDTGDNESDSRIEQLESSLNGMVGIVQTLATGQSGLQEAIAKLTESISSNNSQSKEEDFSMDDVDLETMSRKDLIAFISKQNESAINKAMSPFGDQIKSLGGKLDETISSYTVAKFQESNPDLMEWKTEIRDILQSGRSSQVADAYKLAKIDNPEKAKKIDLKYKPVIKNDEGKDKIFGFKGFPPNAGSAGGKSNTRMTAKDAATSAWDEATAAMPGIDQFLASSDAGIQ